MSIQALPVRCLCAALASASLLGGCSPTFNWREVRFEAASLVALLPCKPDRGSRVLALAGRSTEVMMLACEAGDATFVVAMADAGDASAAPAVLQAWKQAALANLGAPAGRDQPFPLAGASVQPPPVRVMANGRRADGSALLSQTAYFARGSQVFQAAIYAQRPGADVADTFFTGLKFQ